MTEIIVRQHSQTSMFGPEGPMLNYWNASLWGGEALRDSRELSSVTIHSHLWLSAFTLLSQPWLSIVTLRTLSSDSQLPLFSLSSDFREFPEANCSLHNGKLFQCFFASFPQLVASYYGRNCRQTAFPNFNVWTWGSYAELSKCLSVGRRSTEGF